MTERTTKKVIVGILLMLIAIPNLQDVPANHTPLYMVSLLSTQRLDAQVRYLEVGGDATDAAYVKYKQRWQETETYLMGMESEDDNGAKCFSITYTDFEDGERTVNAGVVVTQDSLGLRDSEIVIKTVDNNGTITRAQFDNKDFTSSDATHSAILTTCVILLLGSITMLFTADVNNLVLRPIEVMISLVREISDNPLQKEFKSVAKTDIDKNDGMETTLILQTITKIAGLMRVGFGEAGAEIIAKNLSNGDR